jgi:hypothetical protein
MPGSMATRQHHCQQEGLHPIQAMMAYTKAVTADYEEVNRADLEAIRLLRKPADNAACSRTVSSISVMLSVLYVM